MMIVDTHCHASLAWFEPVEALIDQMDRNNVRHAALVQIRGEYNNDYQFECVERFSDRLVSVIAVDRESPDAEHQLERLKERGARGIRLWASWLDDAGLKIWRAAARLGLPVSCNGAAAEFASDEFSQLVERLPNLPIIIEHLGASTNRDRTVLDVTRKKVLALSRFPNTCMKIHGLGEFATRAMPVTKAFPFVQPIPARLLEAYEAFGAERLMWGSNFPPVSGLEGYRRSLQLPMQQFADISEIERAQIFGGTAARIYDLRP
jgi:L-fuconolactonase